MFQEYSLVKVKKLIPRPISEIDGWKINHRNPEVGDVGTIVNILQAPNLPIHYVVECSGSNGVTIWLSVLEAEEIELI